MLGRTYETQDCSAARALEIVGERWSLMIIRHALFRDVTRFGDFQRSLGVARNVLAARLDQFVADGVMVRQPLAEGSAHQEYLLTEKGRALRPVIIALTHWGDQWAAPDGPPVTLRHAGCGGEIHQRTVCDCGRTVSAEEVVADPNRSRTAG
ncbi:winged helix-turn-helix transcriptional regulator [Nocardia aurantia]|uniref:Putative HTH-type transcriptional regulator n=1 Tax=Nocardia aurantia TaxID=2585199 RepID=A0A7K0DZP7_9NOCA|nr:helix-turn-helix domain-containing protein [Nocardia aurantia]MQY31300.1 putative HTH-type transcriptional regulator [Nocardia aurantia]